MNYLNKIHEKINSLLIDIEINDSHNTNLYQNEENLLTILHEHQENIEQIANFFLLSTLSNNYPQIVNVLLEKIESKYFNKKMLDNFFDIKNNDKDVPLLYQIYQKSNKRIKNEVAKHIQYIFAREFHLINSTTPNSHHFLITENVQVTKEDLKNYTIYCIPNDINDFEPYLKHLMNKCHNLNTDFFSNYLKEIKRLSQSDQSFVKVVNQVEEKYQFIIESMYLDKQINNNFNQDKSKKLKI
jgi:hypothetical protein